MSMTPPPTPEPTEGRAFWARWRANFLAGIVLVAPLFLTVWLLWSFISWVDSRVARLLPMAMDIPGFLHIPGYGLVFFVVFTALVGLAAKNYAAARTIAWSERMLDNLPIVRTVYNGIKQIAETMLADSKTSFKQACLVEYPRRGIWAVAFISTVARGEVGARMPEDELMSVFLPTTPNPTSGFLLFVPRRDIILLDMTVEEAAKLVISAGLVTPSFDKARDAEPVPMVVDPSLVPTQGAAAAS
jgi:uncharacterized membrane protein